MTQRTKKEILDETVEYYKTHKRASTCSTINGGCYYFINGDMCALGRCFTEEVIEEIRPLDVTASNVVLDNGFKIHSGICPGNPVQQDMLKEEYRGHDDVFWVHLQGLHDDGTYWSSYDDPSLLSKSGKKRLQYLLDEFEDEGKE